MEFFHDDDTLLLLELCSADAAPTGVGVVSGLTPLCQFLVVPGGSTQVKIVLSDIEMEFEPFFSLFLPLHYRQYHRQCKLWSTDMFII